MDDLNVEIRERVKCVLSENRVCAQLGNYFQPGLGHQPRRAREEEFRRLGRIQFISDTNSHLESLWGEIELMRGHI